MLDGPMLPNTNFVYRYFYPLSRSASDDRKTMTLQLSKRLAQPDGAQVNGLQWHSHELPDSNAFVEYVPGRDKLYTPEELATGKPHAMY